MLLPQGQQMPFSISQIFKLRLKCQQWQGGQSVQCLGTLTLATVLHPSETEFFPRAGLGHPNHNNPIIGLHHLLAKIRSLTLSSQFEWLRTPPSSTAAAFSWSTISPQSRDRGRRHTQVLNPLSIDAREGCIEGAPGKV